MEHIKEIWPSAKRLSEILGVPHTTAHSWYRRGSIPAQYDLQIVAAARNAGRSLTLEDLAQARARQAVS